MGPSLLAETMAAGVWFYSGGAAVVHGFLVSRGALSILFLNLDINPARGVSATVFHLKVPPKDVLPSAPLDPTRILI